MSDRNYCTGRVRVVYLRVDIESWEWGEEKGGRTSKNFVTTDVCRESTAGAIHTGIR